MKIVDAAKNRTQHRGGLIDHGGGIIVLSTVVAKWSVAFVIA
jgi:hypothetical protein